MAKLGDDSLVQIATNGRRAMPGYGKLLTADQIRELGLYVRSLKP
jgi:mono/diheme cytochrome c family protein